MIASLRSGVSRLGVDWSQRLKQPIDPYLIWADWSGFGGASVPDPATADETSMRLHVAMELKPGASASLQQRGMLVRECVDTGSNCFVTAVLSRDQLIGLLDDDGVLQLELGFASLAASAHAHPVPTESPRRIAGPVMAVIDNGCAFAHERFRYRRDGVWHTRIAYLWDQSESPDLPERPWRAVPGQGYGRELTGVQIDAALDRWQIGGRVQEDELYRDLDYDKVLLVRTHGTHVLDLAAGAPAPESDSDPAPSIIFVQLPGFAVDDTSGASLVTHMLDALRYIMDRVEPDRPLVVNLSYGSMAGPHDGSTLIEKVMDAAIANSGIGGRLRKGKMAIVLPAGNSFESDGHAVVHLSGDRRARSVLWQVQSGDPTDTFVEIWYPAAAAGKVQLTVTPPVGPPLMVGIDESGVLSSGTKLTEPVCAVIHRRQVAGGRGDAMALIALAPCVARSIGGPAAPAGIWRLELSLLDEGAAVAPEIHLWIERDDPVVGSGSPPRQARFLSEYPPLAKNEDSVPGDVVQRRMTGNSIANGQLTTVVGACSVLEGECSRYSACGPTRNPGRKVWPDCVAKADESASLSGVLAAGTRSGSLVRMNGTSVAAPQVARRILDDFIQGQSAGSTAAAKPLARASVDRQGRGRLV